MLQEAIVRYGLTEDDTLAALLVEAHRRVNAAVLAAARHFRDVIRDDDGGGDGGDGSGDTNGAGAGAGGGAGGGAGSAAFTQIRDGSGAGGGGSAD